jgi:nucleotide-binding universal stress UspA family protein
MGVVFSKILVPYDISAPADNALRQAVKIAAKTNSAGIILLHVIDVPILPVLQVAIHSRRRGEDATTHKYVERVYELMKKYALDIMEEKAREIKSRGISVKTEVRRGSPVDKIIEYARSERVDLIIVGNIGLGGFSRIAALGSVSRGVAERAPCPVMIVH